MLVQAVLDAVKARLETIDGLTVTTDPGATVVVPMAVVSDGEMEYHATFGRGYDTLNINIAVYVSRADSNEGVSEVRAFKSGYGDKSIRKALETAPAAADGLNTSLVAQTGTAGVATVQGETFVTLQVSATAQIEGKES